MSEPLVRFQFIKTVIPEVIVIEPLCFGDERGFFMETFRENAFQEAGISGPFVQDNHSRSAKGVLRGLHFQVPPHPLAKLVRVVNGAAFDVAVDLRPHSPTYGKWVGETLTPENRRMFYVPEGFAHGFLALEDGTEFMYKMSGYYQPEHEKGLMWNDPDVGIDWPALDKPFLVSQKDQNNLSFQDIRKNPVF